MFYSAGLLHTKLQSVSQKKRTKLIRNEKDEMQFRGIDLKYCRFRGI